jgi:glycosyltransferase involved in cell wall biosynthesis
MNVGVIVDNELNNDKRVLREISIIRSCGNNMSVLCFGFNKTDYHSIKDLEIIRIRITRRFKNILFFFMNLIPLYEWIWSSRILKFIRINNIQILHVHDLYMAKAARSGISKSGKNIPLILDLHENFPYTIITYNWTKGIIRNFISKPRKWLKKEKEYLDYADNYIVLSEEFRDDLIGKYPDLVKNSFCILPNVPDLNQMDAFPVNEEKVPFIKNNPIIFYFGVVAERRGIFDALSVFKKVVGKGFNSDFLIIGPVDKKDREKLDTYLKSELSGRIIYIPWIDISELPTYLSLSDICIAPFHKNPHHESGVANKIFDYMYGRKPIIASDCKPQKNLIEMYNCGIVYSNNEEMEAAMINLLSDERMRTKMGLNGHKAIIEAFNIEHIKGNLITLYRNIEKEMIHQEY